MNAYQTYVYTHHEPGTGEVVYIGKGTKDRAWLYRSARSGGRSAEHLAWLDDLHARGYTMADIVAVVAHQLTESEAKLVETSLIHEMSPRFNKAHNLEHRQRKRQIDPYGIREFAKNLHAMGYGYQRVAFLLGADKPKTKVMSAKRLITDA